MISAAMFDLDGTLVETEELKAISHARTVHALSPGVSQEEVAAAYTSDLVGRSRQEVAMALVERFGLEEAARARMADLGETEPWRVLVRLRHGIYDEILADAELLLGQRYQHNIDLLLQMRREGYPT
ncbi:MAG TPA: hypothetical protein VKA51_12245, partial [Rubrobacteraceae bacterium]|nr:hypothetical protein [Rubrobacteraceae bacterium]